jgi:hypothetical protein
VTRGPTLDGAGEGNRTLVTWLGTKSSTIELHPPEQPHRRGMHAQGWEWYIPYRGLDNHRLLAIARAGNPSVFALGGLMGALRGQGSQALGLLVVD